MELRVILQAGHQVAVLDGWVFGSCAVGQHVNGPAELRHWDCLSFPLSCCCVCWTPLSPFLLVISVGLRFAHPRAGGGDVQVSFGEGEGQQLCLQ